MYLIEVLLKVRNIPKRPREIVPNERELLLVQYPLVLLLLLLRLEGLLDQRGDLVALAVHGLDGEVSEVELQGPEGLLGGG